MPGQTRTCHEALVVDQLVDMVFPLLKLMGTRDFALSYLLHSQQELWTFNLLCPFHEGCYMTPFPWLARTWHTPLLHFWSITISNNYSVLSSIKNGQNLSQIISQSNCFKNGNIWTRVHCSSNMDAKSCQKWQEHWTKVPNFENWTYPFKVASVASRVTWSHVHACSWSLFKAQAMIMQQTTSVVSQILEFCNVPLI